MQNSERLMSEFNELHYVIDKNMPEKQKGLYIDNYIYLNANQDEDELYSTIAEEVGHHLTSTGDIIDQTCPDSRKQEKKARFVGYQLTVSLDSLIDCYKEGLENDYECADFLNVPLQSFREALGLYKEKLGNSFNYKNYRFCFGTADKLNIWLWE